MDRAGYQPLPEHEDSFWVMKKLDDVEYVTPAACLDYNEVCLLVW